MSQQPNPNDDFDLRAVHTDTLEVLNDLVAQLLDIIERFVPERFPPYLVPAMRRFHEVLCDELQSRGVFFAFYTGSSSSDAEPQEPEPKRLEAFRRFIDTLHMEELDDDR